MIKNFKILVSGRVQGVGYRNFTKKSAEDLGLSGWVRNLDDGRVEVLVTGEENQIERFLEQLKRGPLMAKVTDLRTQPVELNIAPTSFTVLLDGVSE
jgi:acylphosphatase